MRRKQRPRERCGVKKLARSCVLLRFFHQLHIGEFAVAQVLDELEFKLEDGQRGGVETPDALALEVNREGLLHRLPVAVARPC